MRNTSSTKRFMAPSGGSVSAPPPAASTSTSGSTGNNFTSAGVMSSNTRVPLAGGRQHLQSQQSVPPSRFLVTVIPPGQLPHDPPHPRTSTFCSGYGPPSKFRRGTLVPLHSTLAGQAAAIAREYGLPSTGGIVFYLVELTQAQQNPLGDALIGGPRIGDEAWQLLWGQLFNPPTPQDDYEASFSEEDEPYFDRYPREGHNTSIPAMPPLPPSMRAQANMYGPAESSIHDQTSDLRPQSPSEHHSDVSSLADNSSALASEDLLGHQSTVSSNTSHVFSPASASMRQTKSSNTSHSYHNNHSIPSSPHTRPYSSASRGRARNHPRGQPRRSSNANSRSNASRHSVRSNRSYSHSNTSADEPLYGEAVVVGKIEFDIDNRRGAGKWFDAWVQSANNPSPGESTPMDFAQRTSRQMISRHQPSESGSLLRSRNLVSEFELPTISRSPSAQESLTDARPPSIITREEASDYDAYEPLANSANRPLSQGSMLQASSSARSSIAGPEDLAVELQDSIESTPQQSLPRSIQAEHPFTVNQEDTNAEDAFDSLGESKRTSQASQFSMVSPSPAPELESMESSQDIASWQTQGAASKQEVQHVSGERSSSSSFGNEANIEAMNATPRVRAPSKFIARSSSPSISASPTTSPLTHKRNASEVSVNSSAVQSTHDDDFEQQDDAEGDQSALEQEPPASDSARRSMPDSAMSTRSSLQDPIPSESEHRRMSVVSQPSVDGEGMDQVARESFDGARASGISSSASSRSRESSSSFDAVSIGQQDGYQALDGDDLATGEHDSDLQDQPAIVTTSSSPGHEDESHYEPSETGDAASDGPQDPTEFDGSKGDPLKDMFPSDANTWAQIKYSYDGQDDSATDSPAEEIVQTALGLGISSSSMMKGQAIPPSASSSLDPFEYDDEGGSTLNSPIGPPEDDVKEVTDLLKANSPPAHIGLSSPINLDEPAKRLSRHSEEASVENSDGEAVMEKAVPVKRGKGHSRAPSQASMASSMRLSAQISLSPGLNPAMIALPESTSNRTLASLAPSTSEQSLASIASQSSIWAPEPTLTEVPKMTNRDARLPFDWADQLSAMGNYRSRGNSTATDADESETGLSMPVGELPQFVNRVGDAPQSRASLASLYAQSARSRSSSVEMMDNLDEIERALAELSPRALKPVLQGDARPPPSLAAFLRKTETLNSVPGYNKDSLHEQMAPVTPSATTSEDGTASRESPTNHTKSLSIEGSAEQYATHQDRDESSVRPSPSPPLSAKSTASTSGYMAPPLPLKIRTDRSAPSSPAPVSDRGDPTPLAAHLDLPSVETPIRPMTADESVTSPGGESRASTTIAYDIPSNPNSPQQRVTFASETQEHPATPSAKTGMSGKFAAGLKLKGWSGKNSTKETASTPSQSKEANSPSHTKEPAKSPLPGLKGFKWWQKDGHPQTDESAQKLAAEISLPASPSTSSATEAPASILQKPNPPFSQTARIPRKSSLASLAATARSQDSLSPNMQNAYSTPLPAPSPSSMASPQFLGAYPSPPTHTSLPSPPRRPLPLPSFMPAYPPQFIVDEDERGQPTPPLIRNDSSTTQSTSAGVSPQISARTLAASSSPMVASASLPVLSNSVSQSSGGYHPHLQRTPELGGNSRGTFLGQEGRSEGHTTSAPVTPVYASQTSLVSSSGRFGKPAKANPAKNNFRLSADADLSKMMHHMQAIEFGEDAAQAAAPGQGHVHPARNASSRGNFGLGLGLPGTRKNLR